mgnify:CR=1 FL=1
MSCPYQEYVDHVYGNKFREAMVRGALTGIRMNLPEARDDKMFILEKALLSRIRLRDYRRKLVAAFQEDYTPAEMQEILQFVTSPVGRKYLEKMSRPRHTHLLLEVTAQIPQLVEEIAEENL